MAAAPFRFLGAALWPLTIWSSLSHFEEHAADDFVERTFPIVATAIGFWLCAGAIVALTMMSGGGGSILAGEGGEAIQFVRRGSGFVGVLWFFLPVIYIIGFWLYTARAERYRT